MAIHALKFSQWISRKYIHSFAQYSTKSHNNALDVEELYIQPQIQDLLLKITGFDLKKIFYANYVKEIESPQYKLLTEDQLKEFESEAKIRAREKLKMPPFKKMWDPDISKFILEKNQVISQFELTDTKYVFVDISPDVSYKDRCVSIRETDGTLRLAANEEKDRLVHLFLPRPGKYFNMPKMFEEEYLEKVLIEKRYKYILDRACIQFEPNDPNYIRVSQRTYEHISLTNSFDDLRSTRHFGPMVFYFLIHKNVDAIFKDMLNRELLKDAVSFIELYNIIHPKSKSAIKFNKNMLIDDIDKIKSFIKLEANNKREFDSYFEIEKPKKIKHAEQ